MLEPIGASPTRDELVYASLRRAIVEGSLVPGQEVVVTTVAAQRAGCCPAPRRPALVYAAAPAIVEEGCPGRPVAVAHRGRELGVSRVPVMHACQRLVGEGFLVANPRRSVTVPPLTEERQEEFGWLLERRAHQTKANGAGLERKAKATGVLASLECLALEEDGRLR